MAPGACDSEEDALSWAQKMPTYGLVEVRPELSSEAGGRYTENVIADAGHSPHIEQPSKFVAALVAGLSV